MSISTVLGASPPVKGQGSLDGLRRSALKDDSPGSLRCSAFICRLLGNATSLMSRFAVLGYLPQ